MIKKRFLVVLENMKKKFIFFKNFYDIYLTFTILNIYFISLLIINI